MKTELIVILILVVLAIGGWIWGIIEYKKAREYKQDLIELDMYNLSVLRDKAGDIQIESDSLIEALKNNEKRVAKFREELMKKKRDSISLKEAQDIINSILQ